MCVCKYQSVLLAIKNEEKQEAIQRKPPPNKSKPLVKQASAANTMIFKKSIVESSRPSEPTAETSNSQVEEVQESESSHDANAAVPLIPSSLSLHAHALDISDQIEAAVSLVGPFLCRLLVEHKSSLSKVLVGTDGRLLLSDGEPSTRTFKEFKIVLTLFIVCIIVLVLIFTAVLRLAENSRVVELTMLLCSQVTGKYHS